MNDGQAWTRARETFAADLLPTEKLLWAGQPDVDVIFHPSDAYLIPFSLLFLGFALFWEWGVLHTSGSPPGDWFFKLWGIPFTVIGLYLAIGRFVANRWIKRRTFFALTDRRVLVKARLLRDRFLSADIRQVPFVKMTSRRDGGGTIDFGLPTLRFWTNTGSLEMWSVPIFSGVPVFFDIHDVDGVHKLVMQQRDAPQPR
jgi:hypothetical protein